VNPKFSVPQEIPSSGACFSIFFASSQTHEKRPLASSVMVVLPAEKILHSME